MFVVFVILKEGIHPLNFTVENIFLNPLKRRANANE